MKNQISHLSLKAVGIGLLLIPVNAMWQMMGLRWDIAHMSMISLLYNGDNLLGHSGNPVSTGDVYYD